MSERYDDGRFRSLLDEVEELLGWLKGVEQVWYWGEQAIRDYHQWREENGVIPADLNTPVYWTPTDPAVGFGIIINAESPYVPGGEAQILGLAQEAFDSGVTWANGVSEYLYSVCDWFTQCDPRSLRNAALDLDKEIVVESLTADLNEGLEGVMQRFYGRDADAFQEFYRDVDPKVKMWGEFAGIAATGIAATAALVEEAQNGLIPIVKGARDSLKQQLQIWAGRDNHPGFGAKAGGSLFPQGVLDIITFATSVANLVPGPHQPVTRVVGGVTGVINQINRAADSASTKEVEYQTEFAGDIYYTLSEEIHRQGTAISEGTARMKIEKLGPVANHVTGLPASRWFTDRVPGIRDVSWEYDLPDAHGI